ncbi:MAG: Asp-tRNA(Asn)/Glu-tRNA(Gln) amidotransferase GatCAB subunit A [Proteobacteria bacterium]|nr:MAG: Asp-tRNA(Asn)/Glu-tRNA(Gln) amidotransferase GatCAB subunit A [Pseudomonadota bacterium]
MSPLDPFGAFLARRDERQLADDVGRLRVAIKDNLLTREGNWPTTCGSELLATYRAPYEATCVARLRAAGAVIVGKTNLDEFAMGSSTERSAFFPCRNPWALNRVPGGSSGGSAAAVAAGLCDVALGSDTGGSIRQPAAFCGVTGLKPTYGRVSRFGLIAFASSLDVVGPLGRSVAAVAQALGWIAGPDGRDATCIGAAQTPEPACWLEACERPTRGLRLGVLDAALADARTQRGVSSSVQAALRTLEAEGVELQPIELPTLNYALATYYVLAMAEASTNLARFDGLRYGRRAADGDDLAGLLTRSRGEGFGREVKRRILLGSFALSVGYREAHIERAQRVRRLIADEVAAAFERCDAIALPTTPTVAFRLGERLDDPTAMYAADSFTVGASLAGLPALSLPCGLADALPVGLQLIAPALREDTLFALGGAYQRVTDWHQRRPGGEV